MSWFNRRRAPQTLSVAAPQLLTDAQVHHGIHPAYLPYGAFSVLGGMDGGVDGVLRTLPGNWLWGDLITNATYVAAYPNNAGIADWRDRGFHEALPFNIQATGSDKRVFGFVLWSRNAGELYLWYKVEGYHEAGANGLYDPYTRPPEFVRIKNTERAGGANYAMTDKPVATASGRFVYLHTPSGEAGLTLWFDWQRWSLGGNNGLSNFGGWRSDFMGVPPAPTPFRLVWEIPTLKHPGPTTTAGATYPAVQQREVTREAPTLGKADAEGALTFYLDATTAGFAALPPLFYYRYDFAGATTSFAMTLVAGTIYKATIPPPKTAVEVVEWNFSDSAAIIRYPTGTANFQCTVSAGRSKEGWYRPAIRLVDTNRSRYSNLIPLTALRANGSAARFVAGGTTVEVSDGVLRSSTSGPTALGPRGFAHLSIEDTGSIGWGADWRVKEQWNQYQFWCTTRGVDSESDPGLVYNLGDTLNVDDAFEDLSRGNVVSFIVTCAEVFRDQPRADAANSTNASPDIIPVNDEALAAADPITGQYNPKSHEYRVWWDASAASGALATITYPLLNIYAIHSYQGLTVAVVRDPGGTLKLIWSDGLVSAPENFPIGNEYELGYQSARDLRFVEASDYLYLLGDGPIYQMRRDGIYLDVLKVNESFPLVSRDAVCSIGYGMIAVSESGVFAIDGASGSPQRIKSLDRLVRDRWVDSRLRSEVSVAYDAAQEAVHILCPGLAEMVTIWLAANRVTMQDGATFSMVRPLKVLDRGRGFVQRAVFINWLGKFVVPNLRESGTPDNITMHGLTDLYGMTAPGTWNAKIDSWATAVVNGETVTNIALDKADGSAFDITGHVLSGASIAFLTGTRAGELHQLWWNNSAVVGAIVRVRGDVTAGLTAGDWVALSPIPVTLVGGPFEGMDGRRWFNFVNVGSGSYVLNRLGGSDASNLSGVPLFKLGCAAVSAVLDLEPRPAPDTAATDPLYFFPAAGALSRWVKRTDATLSLADAPTAGTAVVTDVPVTAAINAPDGYGGRIVIPVMLSDVSSLSYDLLYTEFAAILNQAEL